MSEPKTERPKRRRWLVLLALAPVLYLGAGALAAALLTTRMSLRYDEPAPDGYEAVRLTTNDGLGIGAWWCAPENARSVVVLVHGNNASRSVLVESANAFVDAGHAVLPISVRAHGDSDGIRNDIGLSARHDLAAAVEYARERRPDLPRAFFGLSLGAAASLFAAQEVGEAVGAYVLVGPYADLRLATRRRTKKYLPWGVEQLAYGALELGGRITLPQIDRIAPASAARHVPASAEVLIVAGGSDQRAPPSDARRIAEAVPQARVLVLPGLDHDALGDLVRHDAWAEVLATVDP